MTAPRSPSQAWPPSTPRFVMIRHGKTEANTQGVLMGQTDSPLRPDSLTAARALGHRLRGLLTTQPTPTLYTSDLGRAHRTAQTLAAADGPPPLPDPAMRERDFGRYTGHLLAALARDPAWAKVDVIYHAPPSRRGIPPRRRATAVRPGCTTCTTSSHPTAIWWSSGTAPAGG